MIVSCNELDALVRKAFRGAGYHWGEAEEAGKAAIWLARNGLSPATLTLSLLRSAANNIARLRPAVDKHCWAESDSEICPLLAGIALADEAISALEDNKVRFSRLHTPGFLLPFLGQLALIRNKGIRLSLSQIEVTVTPDGIDIDGSAEALTKSSPAMLREVELVPGLKETHASLIFSTEISSDEWDRLNDFAVKTYVPATDHSRLAGAGAGVTDND
jgi:hypothetical protein